MSLIYNGHYCIDIIIVTAIIDIKIATDIIDI